MMQSKDKMSDLPGLESVTGGGWAALVASLVFCAGLGAVPAVGTALWLRAAGIRLIPGLGWPLELLALMGLCSALLLLVGILWVRKWDFVFGTDGEGLSARGLGHKTFVPWSEVTATSMERGTMGGNIYVIGTPKGAIRVRESVTPPNPLVPSIWQHLRRLGKQDDTFLSPLMKSLWTPIPDAAPQEMDWHNPKAPTWSLSIALLFAVAAVVYAWTFKDQMNSVRHSAGVFHLLFAVVASGFAALVARLYTVSQCALRTDRFEGKTGVGRFSLAWADVTEATWRHSSLVIAGRGIRGRAVIPYDLKNDESVRAVLSAVRRLRLLDNIPPIPIPETILATPLLREMQGEPVAGESAEMAMPLGLRIMILATSLVFAAFLFALSFHSSSLFSWSKHSSLILRLVAVVDVIIAFFMFRPQTLRADTEGLTRKNGFSVKKVRWEQVTTYEIKQNKQLPEIAMHVLKDSTGRVLMQFSMFGTKEQKEQFSAILNARLGRARQ